MSKDTIYREDAIDAIECVTWYHQNRHKDMVSGANSAEHQAWYKAEDIYDALKAIPSADRPQGEWIKPYGDSRFMCSICKGKENVPTCMGKPSVWDYCPNCGASMREREGE